MTWKDIKLDKRFRDSEFKIESNARGHVIMSETRSWHRDHIDRIATLLRRSLPHGHVLTRIPVKTADGNKEADGAWLNYEAYERFKDEFSLPIAPDLCIEVMAHTNTHPEMMRKKELFLNAGAAEYWLCVESGDLEFFDRTGPLDLSRLCPQFPSSVS